VHILLIHQAFAALNEPGGTRHYEMARYLAARGHTVTVIASPVSYLTGKSQHSGGFFGVQEETSDGVHILRSYTYPAWHRSFIHRVFSFLSFMISSFIAGLKIGKVDVIWGTSPPIFQGGTAWALARLKRARFIFEVRDLWPAFAVGMGVLRNPFLISSAEWFERFLYRQADQVVINSPGFMAHVKERGAQRVALVANGADPAMFDPHASGSEFRQQNHLEDKYVVLYAGAHGMSNDLAIVLEAAVKLQNFPEIRLVFLGDGKEKPALMEQAEKMSLLNVMFLPSMPKSEISAALAGVDACLAILKPIPLYKTVYPNKVFDYMAAARPVLLAIDGVIRIVVEEAQAGIFVPPGNAQALADAILFLAREKDQAVQMGWNGRRYVEEHFDRAVLAGEMEKILTSN
jgi:glycosyltransferase involved in cell wall biosynthesis